MSSTFKKSYFSTQVHDLSNSAEMEDYLGSLFYSRSNSFGNSVTKREVPEENPIVPITRMNMLFNRATQIGGTNFLCHESLDPPHPLIPTAVKMVFRPCSLTFLLSIIAALGPFYCIGCFTLVLATGYQGFIEMFDVNSVELVLPSKYADQVTAVGKLALLFHQIFVPGQELILRSIKIMLTQKHAKYMNDWNDFEIELNSSFPNMKQDFYQFNLKTWRNRLAVFYILCPFIFLTGTMMKAGYLNSGFKPLDYFLYFCVGYWVATIEGMNDGQFLLQLVTIRMAFEKVHSGIASQCEQYGLRYISFDHVKTWSQLIVKTRKQCRQCVQSVTPLELFSLGAIFFGVLFYIYTVQELVSTGLFSESNISITSFYTSQIVLKLLMKIYFAGKISKAEHELCTYLLSLKDANIDINTSIEIKHLQNLLSTVPTTITFGNLIQLNNKLILSIIGQVATYLIVLMQFESK